MRRAGPVAAAATLAAGLAATLGTLAGRSGTPPAIPQKAIADGCGRDYLSQTKREIPTWVYVNDHDAPVTGPPPPAQRLEGVISSRYLPDLAVHPTEEDLPTIHRAYDFNFDVLPNPAYRSLLGGDPAQHTGNFSGRTPETARIHVEREQAALPRFAWPEQGDRVAIVGSWIWDCGHWTPAGERTEIHSYRALWLERNPRGPSPLSPSGASEGDLVLSSDKTYAGVEADCAHLAKGVVLVFESCLKTESEWQDIAGTYRFRLPVPTRPRPGARLVVRVLDAGSTRGAPPVHARARGAGVDVTVTAPATTGRLLVVAKRVLARWTGTPKPEHLRVRFTRLLVRRALDPGCPDGQAACGSKETTHGEQVSSGPGEWNVYLDVGGRWTVWGSGLIRARDGQVFRRGPAVDLYVARGRPWRLFVFTRECDFGSLGTADGAQHPMTPCPRSNEFGTFDGDDVPGFVVRRFRSPAASIGSYAARPSRTDSTCPQVNRLGCYALDYIVSRVGKR